MAALESEDDDDEEEEVAEEPLSDFEEEPLSDFEEDVSLEVLSAADFSPFGVPDLMGLRLSVL